MAYFGVAGFSGLTIGFWNIVKLITMLCAAM
jgi:hypothetical protein